MFPLRSPARPLPGGSTRPTGLFIVVHCDSNGDRSDVEDVATVDRVRSVPDESVMAGARTGDHGESADVGPVVGLQFSDLV
jgi:hypothetical protein